MHVIVEFGDDFPRQDESPEALRARLLRRYGTDPEAYYDRVYALRDSPSLPADEVAEGISFLERTSIVPGKKRALVIGAGLGGDAFVLRKSGYDVTVTETSKVAAAFLRKHGFAVWEEDVSDTGIRGEFDVIVVCHVFQHMTEGGVERTIRDMQKGTVLGGMNIIIAYGDMHLKSKFLPFAKKKYYFSQGSLSRKYEGWRHVAYHDEIEPSSSYGSSHYIRGIFLKLAK